MSKDLNQCNFIGRLGNDPEIKYTQSGKAVANFSIACADDYKDEKKTNWINIVAFDRLAEIVGEYLNKGSQVFISGKQKTDKWEKDGVTRYTTKIVAREMQMLGGRGERNEKPETASAPAQQSEAPYDDDIPF